MNYFDFLPSEIFEHVLIEYLSKTEIANLLETSKLGDNDTMWRYTISPKIRNLKNVKKWEDYYSKIKDYSIVPIYYQGDIATYGCMRG